MRVVSVLTGLIIASGPFAAWFATGISGPEQPELYEPTMPITSGFRAYLRVLVAAKAVPPTGLGSRVVAGLVPDRVRAGPVATPLEDEPDRLHHLVCLGDFRALQGKIGDDQEARVRLSAGDDLAADRAR